MSIREFLSGGLDYMLPPPGGSIFGGGPTTNHDADQFLAAIAAGLKGQPHSQIVSTLQRRMDNVKFQRHFDTETDVMLIRRLGEWIKELVN